MSAHTCRLLLHLHLLAALGLGVSLRSNAEPPAPRPQTKVEPRRDRDGDPLPTGAIARLGTLRFRTESAGYMNELAFAPDGKTLAVASLLGLWFFDADTGKQTKSIPPRGWSFQRIAHSPDGKRLLAAVGGMKPIRVKNRIMYQTGVQIWDVPGGRKTSEVELTNILCLGWTAEGHPLVACHDKDTIILHDIEAGRKRRFSAQDLLGPISPHCAVGKKIMAAAGRKPAVIHVWDWTRGEERWTFKTEGAFSLSHSLVHSPDERWLASLSSADSDKNTLQLWDLTTGKAKRMVTGDQQHLASVVFTADSKTLATIGQQEVRFWDTASGQERGRLQENRSFNTRAFAFSPDGKTLATMESLCGAIHLWDVATGKLKPEAEGHSTNWVRTPTFSPDGKRVTTSGGLDGTIRIWDTASGRQLALLRRSPSTVLECALSADGRTLVSCWDDRVLLSDAATGRERHVLEAHDWRREKGIGGAYMRMHVSSDGRKAIVLRHVSGGPYSGGGGGGRPRGGSENNWQITGWDTATRKQLFRRQFAYQDSHQYLAISADANVLAVPATKREPMHLENVETGESLLNFPILKGRNIPIVFSPDGRLLLSETYPPAPGGSKRTLCVWEVLTARELLALPISIYLSATAAFSPDGRLLATIAPENEILFWDLKSAKELHRFKGYGSPVTSLAFSPDGRRLVSGLSHSSLLVWDVPLPETAASADKLDSESAAKAWADLAGRDAVRAFRARWTLASSPKESVPFLQEHLHPVKAADPQRLRRLLADLESEQFAVREKA